MLAENAVDRNRRKQLKFHRSLDILTLQKIIIFHAVSLPDNMGCDFQAQWFPNTDPGTNSAPPKIKYPKKLPSHGG